MRKIYILLLLTFGLGQDYSLQFDGVDDYVRITQNNHNTEAEAISIAFWVLDEWESDNDIYIDCWIEYHQAVFGDKINVHTLGGEVRLKIPSGIKSGHLLRLKKKGVAASGQTIKSGSDSAAFRVSPP